MIRIKHTDSSNNLVAFIIECKPLYKTTIDLLMAGLRPIVLYKEVLGQDAATNQAKFQNSANEFVAIIIAHTYSYKYIAKSGASRGCIMTCQAMIFLYVSETDPFTALFYHAGPKAEVEDGLKRNGIFAHECTAIGQLFSFCLMAHDHKVYSQQWRKQMRDTAPGWAFADSKVDIAIPLVAADVEKPLSACKPRHEIMESYRSPIKPRSKAKCGPT